MKSFTAFLLIFTLNTYAIDVTPVKRGDKVPKDGFFVDTNNMKKFRKINEDKKTLEKKVVKLEELSIIKDQRIEVYQEMNKNSERAVSSERAKGNLKGIGGFIIGVLATSVAAYAAIQVTK